MLLVFQIVADHKHKSKEKICIDLKEQVAWDLKKKTWVRVKNGTVKKELSTEKIQLKSESILRCHQ